MTLMTLQQVAARLGISHRTAQRRMADGTFPLSPVSWHKWPRFTPADLEAIETGMTPSVVDWDSRLSPSGQPGH
ncbi:MAG: helix-turn-helix domain-containing protein [Acidobacteriota bacterium]